VVLKRVPHCSLREEFLFPKGSLFQGGIGVEKEDEENLTYLLIVCSAQKSSPQGWFRREIPLYSTQGLTALIAVTDVVKSLFI